MSIIFTKNFIIKDLFPFISEDKKFINKAKKYYKNSYSIKQILALI